MRRTALPKLAAALLLSLAWASVGAAQAFPSIGAPKAYHTPGGGAEAPYAGNFNHGIASPQFRWGWFGAERFPEPPHYHRGYYRNLFRWRKW